MCPSCVACEVNHVTLGPRQWLFLLPGSTECVARNFGHDSVVCECNSTYCDSVGSVTLPPLGQYSSYLTSMAGNRLEAGQGRVQVNSTATGEWCCGLMLLGWVVLEHSHSVSFVYTSLSGLRLTIVPDQKYQKIRGFGGAMTDAAAINILSLSAGAQDQLLRQYFSPEGAPSERKTK